MRADATGGYADTQMDYYYFYFCRKLILRMTVNRRMLAAPQGHRNSRRRAYVILFSHFVLFSYRFHFCIATILMMIFFCFVNLQMFIPTCGFWLRIFSSSCAIGKKFSKLLSRAHRKMKWWKHPGRLYINVSNNSRQNSKHATYSHRIGAHSLSFVGILNSIFICNVTRNEIKM